MHQVGTFFSNQILFQHECINIYGKPLLETSFNFIWSVLYLANTLHVRFHINPISQFKKRLQETSFETFQEESRWIFYHRFVGVFAFRDKFDFFPLLSKMNHYLVSVLKLFDISK